MSFIVPNGSAWANNRFEKNMACLTAVLGLISPLAACAQSQSGEVSGSKSESSASEKPRPIQHPVPAEKKTKQIEQIEGEYKKQIVADVTKLRQETENYLHIYQAGGGKEQYPSVHQLYERIQPVAESFEPTQFAIVNLDRLLNERETDYQLLDDTDTQEWVGWHRVEKDVYTQAEDDRKKVAQTLLDNTKKLEELVKAPEYNPNLDQICKDAIALLEEAVTTKAAGQEEKYAKSDLADLVATIGGAKRNVELVKPLVKDQAFMQHIDNGFQKVEAELQQYQTQTGYIGYDQLNVTQKKRILDAVNALRRYVADLDDAVVNDSKARLNREDDSQFKNKTPVEQESSR